jgi:hypothetical protein
MIIVLYIFLYGCTSGNGGVKSNDDSQSKESKLFVFKQQKQTYFYKDIRLKPGSSMDYFELFRGEKK